MMLPFLIAQCSSLLLVAVVILLCRPFIRVAGDYAKTHFQIYALAYLKWACLVTLALGGTFKETWQTVTSDQAAGWAVWDWMIHLMAPVLSGVAVTSAFLDQSKQRADEVKTAQDKKISETTPPFSAAPIP